MGVHTTCPGFVFIIIIFFNMAIEAETELWPHIWAGRDDPGVEATAQEEEEISEEDEGSGLWRISTGKIWAVCLRIFITVTV